MKTDPEVKQGISVIAIVNAAFLPGNLDSDWTLAGCFPRQCSVAFCVNPCWAQKGFEATFSLHLFYHEVCCDNNGITPGILPRSALRKSRGTSMTNAARNTREWSPMAQNDKDPVRDAWVYKSDHGRSGQGWVKSVALGSISRSNSS